MKDISIYFKPVQLEKSIFGDIYDAAKIHDQEGFPELDEKGLALIYVPEYRRSVLKVSGENQSFRDQFYNLNRGDNWKLPIYDLGTITPGETIEDTYFALSQVVGELVKKDIIPFVVGGGQDLMVACYKGFEALERMINICSLDSKLDVGEPDESVSSMSYVSHLLMQRPCYLFNYSTIGVQRPFNTRKEMELFEKLYFDAIRLGAFVSDPKIAEPHLRNSDLLSIDFRSIRNAVTDNTCYENPNGFDAHQICQIMKYAGVSDKMSCVNVCDVHPGQGQGASQLLAQMIWYFVDGISQRVGDFPIGTKMAYTKFHVSLDDFEDDLVFYKSNKSERWWLEVSYPAGQSMKYERHHLVPCDYVDYQNATRNRIPDLWWRTLQKLS